MFVVVSRNTRAPTGASNGSEVPPVIAALDALTFSGLEAEQAATEGRESAGSRIAWR
jgi:hypothetical protein